MIGFTELVTHSNDSLWGSEVNLRLELFLSLAERQREDELDNFGRGGVLPTRRLAGPVPLDEEGGRAPERHIPR